MNYVDDTMKQLREQNEALRERVAHLEGLMRATDYDPALRKITGITTQEEALLRHLLARPLGTKESLMAAIYGNGEWDVNPKIIDVFVCKIRKKLKLYGIEIKTLWGRGYMMEPTEKAKVRMLEAICND